MPCYHPMKAIKKRGSNQYRMIPHERSKNTEYVPYLDYETGEVCEQIMLPCGKCIGCRLEYSRQWANRCVLESLSYPEDQCWFLTLTIDDDHLKDYVTKNGFATCKADDISTFMKALRGRWSDQHGVTAHIRFFGCSEYGDESMRPHYHLLLFGLPLYDLEFYKNNHDGDVLYKSEELTEIWKKGIVTIGQFNWNTAAYTARYVMKKAGGKNAAFYDALDIEPEKVRMSRRPGIGADFFEHHIDDIYELDEIVLPATKGNSHVISPPKYFDKKIKVRLEAFPDLKLRSGKTFGEVWNQRERIQKLKQQAQDQAHGYDLHDYYQIQEHSKENSMKVFSRGVDK